MSEPLQLTFEYSFEDLKEGIRRHLRSPIRYWSRVLGSLLCIFGWLALGLMVLLLQYAPAGVIAGAEVVLIFIVLLLISAVNIAQYPWLNAMIVKKRYRHMYGERQDWQFTQEGYSVRVGERSRGAGNWLSFARLVSTPTGVLLYHANGVFNWLPRRSFCAETEVIALVDMARANNLKVVQRG